jgi:predicted Fe-Mo cluster-binding NifX family protein
MAVLSSKNIIVRIRTNSQKSIMKKVALPIENGKLGSLFEHCTLFKVFTVENRLIVDEQIIESAKKQSELFPSWFFNLGVTDVITNRVSLKTVNEFNSLKINVFVGVEIKSPILLLSEFLEGSIETNAKLCE